MAELTKTWNDSSVKGKSYIERLDFPSDRKWGKCTVTVENTGSHKMNFQIDINAKSHCLKHVESALNPRDSWTYECNVNDTCSVNVTGQISVYIIGMSVAGKVTVTCTYDDEEVLKKQSAFWKEECTLLASVIENLFLDNNHKWERCDIKVQGLQNKNTGCMLTLIVDGEIFEKIPQFKLEGTQSKIFTYDIKKAATLVVAGYVDNQGTGAGATITLTGYYKQ